MIHDVRDYGAVGDGATLDTDAIQGAVDACSRAGGGTVVIPSGTFLIGGIQLRDHITFHIANGATLLGSLDFEDYRGLGSLLSAANATGVRIEGYGTLDGRGAAFDIPEEGLPWGGGGGRATLIRLSGCRRASIAGIELRDSAVWALHLIGCTGVNVDGITIDSRVRLNNDGIDIDSCERVTVSNCVIHCGDDAIAMKTNIDRPCRDIAVTNCFMSSRWAGVRIGPESKGGYSNIVVSNCVMRDVWGCAIKMQEWEGSRMENITFSNIAMENVTGPIHLRVSGAEREARLEASRDQPSWTDYKVAQSVGSIRNVRFSNITARVVDVPPIQSDDPKTTVPMQPGEVRTCLSVVGCPGHEIENITFSDVHITYAGGGKLEEVGNTTSGPLNGPAYPEYFDFGTPPAYGAVIRHARNVVMRNVTMTLESPDERPELIVEDTDGFTRR